MPTAQLEDRRLIRISGADAESFLERLITNNVLTMQPGTAYPSALLTPQGKILFDFLISKDGSGYLIDIRADETGGFLQRMTMYKLRADVSLEVRDTPVYAVWDTIAENALTDSRFPAESQVGRLYGAATANATQADWNALRIRYGMAESGTDYALSDAFPHDVLMDLNAGVDFRKGCFVGQEVVSRMKHRGTARRRVVTVTAQEALPATGTAIQAGGKPLGELGTVSGKNALAIVRIDRAGEALTSGVGITAGDIPVSMTLPDWTGLTFPTGQADDD